MAERPFKLRFVCLKRKRSVGLHRYSHVIFRVVRMFCKAGVRSHVMAKLRSRSGPFYSAMAAVGAAKLAGVYVICGVWDRDQNEAQNISKLKQIHLPILVRFL